MVGVDVLVGFLVVAGALMVLYGLGTLLNVLFDRDDKWPLIERIGIGAGLILLTAFALFVLGNIGSVALRGEPW